MEFRLEFTDPAANDIKVMIQKRGEPFRKQLLKTTRLLVENIKHPSLKVHGLRNWNGWKEAYINKADRLVFKIESDLITVAWCGNHDSLDREAFGSAIIEAEKRFKDKISNE